MTPTLHQAAADAEFAFRVALRLIEWGELNAAYKLVNTIVTEGVHIVDTAEGWKSVRRGLPSDATQPKELI